MVIATRSVVRTGLAVTGAICLALLLTLPGSMTANAQVTPSTSLSSPGPNPSPNFPTNPGNTSPTVVRPPVAQPQPRRQPIRTCYTQYGSSGPREVCTLQ